MWLHVLSTNKSVISVEPSVAIRRTSLQLPTSTLHNGSKSSRIEFYWNQCSYSIQRNQITKPKLRSRGSVGGSDSNFGACTVSRDTRFRSMRTSSPEGLIPPKFGRIPMSKHARNLNGFCKSYLACCPRVDRVPIGCRRYSPLSF